MRKHVRDLLPVVRCSSATRQLDLARSLRRFDRGQAIRAFEAVAAFWPDASLEAGEALFRAAELLRAGQDPCVSGAARVLESFRRVSESAPGTRWDWRARVERAHIYRRCGRLEEASHAYLELARAPNDVAVEERERAFHWFARVACERGEPDRAFRALSRLATTAADPVERARAFAEIAKCNVRNADWNAALATLQHARDALESVLAEVTERGLRARSVLDRADKYARRGERNQRARSVANAAQ